MWGCVARSIVRIEEGLCNFFFNPNSIILSCDACQAILVFDDAGVTVVQPNADGSYWRKIVRNKIARMKEKRREKAAIDFAQANLPVRTEDEAKERVVSTWGPYKSTSGVAKSTVTEGVKKVSKKELKVYAS